MGMTRDVLIGAACAVLAGAAFVVAGPLSPPAGPIQETSPSLADLGSALNSAAGGGTFDAPAFLETSMVPGSALDGKPLPLAGNSDLFINVEIEGVLTSTEFAVIDIAQGIELIEFTDGDDLFLRLRPGPASNQISLLRTLPARDTALLGWYREHINSQGNPRREVVIRLRDQSSTEVAAYNCFGCLIQGLDVRSIDGQVVEQLVIRCEDIQERTN